MSPPRRSVVVTLTYKKLLERTIASQVGSSSLKKLKEKHATFSRVNEDPVVAAMRS